ncbi:MAG: hypothetical protein U0136_00505 [Bdellovibrionota bacterium]
MMRRTALTPLLMVVALASCGCTTVSPAFTPYYSGPAQPSYSPPDPDPDARRPLDSAIETSPPFKKPGPVSAPAPRRTSPGRSTPDTLDRKPNPSPRRRTPAGRFC